MDALLERLIWERAKHCCEYCQMPQDGDVLWFEIDHVVARKHGGKTTSENLALSCFFCNNRKGPNLSGVDPVTGKVATLFNPRTQNWKRHFRFSGATIMGRTQVGRATVRVLEMNLPERRFLREELMAAGRFPPRHVR